MKLFHVGDIGYVRFRGLQFYDEETGEFKYMERMNAEAQRKIGFRQKLFTFWNERRAAEEWGSQDIMLDSGAYTAYTKGAIINLDELMEYLEWFRPQYALQLDVIGDEEATWKNYKKMLDRGLEDVMPVIHLGASDQHIRRVLQTTSFAACGGLVGQPTSKQIKWLDYVWSFPEARELKVKLHVLGVFSREILTRHPFYSADSSSLSWAFKVMKQSDPHSPLKERWKRALLNDRVSGPIVKDEIDHWNRFEDYLTNLWQKRGITWNE